MSIYRDIERLIQYGIKKNLIEDEDKIFIRNSLLSLFNLDEFEEFTIDFVYFTIFTSFSPS